MHKDVACTSAREMLHLLQWQKAKQSQVCLEQYFEFTRLWCSNKIRLDSCAKPGNSKSFGILESFRPQFTLNGNAENVIKYHVIL